MLLEAILVASGYVRVVSFWSVGIGLMDGCVGSQVVGGMAEERMGSVRRGWFYLGSSSVSRVDDNCRLL